LTHLGLDVHKDTISVAILAPDRDGPDVERIAHDEASVRRLVGRFPNPRLLRACYEAGPTGYELARLLHSMAVGCEVIAPSLIPKAPGDKVKTDRRDCWRLARLYRAGELVAIRIPSVQEEAVRDLCRARADMVAYRTRARHRLGKFLLRHGRAWRGGNAWTLTHERWLLAQRFEEPALAATYAHYRAVLDARDAQLEAIQATWPAGMTGRRSPTPWVAWPPTGASPGWARSRWPARSVTGAGSRGRPRSPASVAWCPRSIPVAPPPGGGTSPSVATPTCAPSWSEPSWVSCRLHTGCGSGWSAA